MAKKIDLAEQQLLGFKHAERGYNIVDLVDSMGLTRAEWSNLKTNYPMAYLNDVDRNDIEQFINKKYGRK